MFSMRSSIYTVTKDPYYVWKEIKSKGYYWCWLNRRVTLYTKFMGKRNKFPEDGTYLTIFAYLCPNSSFEECFIWDLNDLEPFLKDLKKIKVKNINELYLPAEVPNIYELLKGINIEYVGIWKNS